MEGSVLRSSLFEKLNILHGFFTKQNPQGVKAPLNVAFGRADSDDAVRNSRKIIARMLSPAVQLVMTHQGHTSRVRFVSEAENINTASAPICDALVTTTPHVALGVYTADCVPILLADPAVPIVGVAHGGWKGLHQGILDQTVACMQAYGAHLEDIVAAIGPCIRTKSYSVGEEFCELFSNFPNCLVRYGETLHLDLPGIACQQLKHLGVQTIDDLGLDTYADSTLFYSYRRAIETGCPLEGAQASVVGLR